MANLFFDRVYVSVANTGSGSTITVGPNVAGYRSFATAGVPNGANVAYNIIDLPNFEIGNTTYTSASNTITRVSVSSSSNNGSPINLSGAATLFITAAAADLGAPKGKVLLATISPTSGTSANSANFISIPYSSLELDFDVITTTGGAVAWTISTDNLATFDTSQGFAGAAVTGIVTISRAGVTGNHIYSGFVTGGGTSGRFTTKTAPITNIRLTIASFAFLSGTVYIYGVP